jgi:tetratricopeptide (TPR) repeat protein
MAAIVISWLIISFIVAALASDREIGFGKALLICLLLSPLIGAIFVATSPKASATPRPPREVDKLIISGDAKFSSGDLDAALADYEKILTLQTGKAPNTHFKIASIYSNKKNSTEAYSHLSKAVQDGFNDFQRIMSAKELAFLRDQVGFQKFAQEGYKLPEPLKSDDDTISKLERLAQLKEKGVLTANEFEEQKRKILAS